MMIRLDVLTKEAGPVDWLVPPPDKLTFAMVPIFNKDGTTLLHDMYVCGDWHGSRRTEAQCRLHFDYITRLSHGEKT
jgi:hypothetical protein